MWWSRWASARVQPPTDKGRRLKIYYMTQVGIRPPEIFSMAQALDRRALCYTVEEFLSSFQEA